MINLYLHIYGTCVLCLWCIGVMGKLAVASLNPTQKNTQNKEEAKKKDKKSKNKNKKNDDVDSEDEEGDVENDEQEQEHGFSQFTQLPLSKEDADDYIEEASTGKRLISLISPVDLKKLLIDVKAYLSLYVMRPEEMLTDRSVEGLASVVFLSAVKTEFSGLRRDAVESLSMFGSSGEAALLTVYRSLCMHMMMMMMFI
jgi:hypothetical protein